MSIYTILRVIFLFVIIGVVLLTSKALAWDVSTAVYDSKSFSVTTQESVPRSMFFKSDGTKMYVVGVFNDRVYQYSLSTAWDVSTASYDSVSFSVGSQDGNPLGVFFRDDGLRMYMVGNSNDTVYQYTLASAWDVSTASYASKSFSAASQTSTPTNLFFKSDGTKMYVAGYGGLVYQYSLSTPWDVNTASYDNKSFNAAALDHENEDTSIFFKSNGSKMYIVGSSFDTVTQYSLSTAWDVSTASYDNKSFYIGSQEFSSTQLFFKSDGAKMYVIGTGNDRVYQYSVTPPDETAPTVQTLSPADNATDVALDANLVITFDEAVDPEAGASNDIVIKKTSDDSTVETIDAQSAQVTGGGTTTITINPAATLSNGTEYYILIGADAFDDSSSNSYAGISDTTTWSFTTVVEETPSGGGGGGSRPINYYTISFSNNNGGSISPGSMTVSNGTSIIFSINPESGYQIEDVLLDGNSIGPVSKYMLDNISSDHTIVVSFGLISPPLPLLLEPEPTSLPPSPVTESPVDEVPITPPIQMPLNSTEPFLGEESDLGDISPEGGERNDAEFGAETLTENIPSKGNRLGAGDKIIIDGLIYFHNLIESPVISMASKIISTIGFISGFTAAVLSAVSSISSSSDLYFNMSRLLNVLLSFFGLRKRVLPWGVVYDSVTKQPLDPANVVLRNLLGKDINSSITDIDGRYGFLVEPGRYKMLVSKTNYNFPSKKLLGKTKDELYNNLYFGEEIEIKSGEVIIKNIPLDQMKFDWNEFAKQSKSFMKFYSKWDLMLRKVYEFSFIVGFVVSVIAFFFAPRPYNTIIFTFYLLLILLRIFGLKPKSLGYVFDKKTGFPLSFAILRVVSHLSNIEISQKVTDKYGRYYCLVPRGKYYLKVERKNPDGSYVLVHKSNIINVGRKGIINKKFQV